MIIRFLFFIIDINPSSFWEWWFSLLSLPCQKFVNTPWRPGNLGYHETTPDLDWIANPSRGQVTGVSTTMIFWMIWGTPFLGHLHLMIWHLQHPWVSAQLCPAPWQAGNWPSWVTMIRPFKGSIPTSLSMMLSFSRRSPKNQPTFQFISDWDVTSYQFMYYT